jgi:hypothetical protein
MGGQRLTIVLSGMIAADPYQGGATWAVLQYLLGFRRLGHEVYFVEPLVDSRLDPAELPLAQTRNAAYFREVAHAFQLEEAAALLLAGTRQTVGLPYAALCELGRRADILINISGMLTDPELISRIPVRVYLDLDPAFIQLWQAVQGIDMRFAGHTHFVTIGQAIGRPDCKVPTCGLNWIPTMQPVVLAEWPRAERIVHDGLTTVGNWRGYGSIEHDRFYGQKAHSFRQFLSLPTRSREKFLPALAIHPQEARDLAALAAGGWRLLDPAQVASTPQRYRAFVQSSKAEIGIAKSGYVVARCGWFSDRSACYLASGRPVIAQETGFSDFLPTGAGLFAFRTAEEALAAIEAMNADYSRHAQAARALAEEYFDSDWVLNRLLSQIGATESRVARPESSKGVVWAATPLEDSGRATRSGPEELPTPLSGPASATALQSALEQVFARQFDPERRMIGVDRRASAYHSSYALEELDVRFSDGTVLPILLKDVSRQGLLDDARRVKPAFLHDPLREVEVYRLLLAARNLGTARYYGSIVDPQAGRYWLFIEKVPGLELYQVGDFAIWEEAARWLARWHRIWSPAEPLDERLASHLLTYNADYYRLWIERARAFVGTPAIERLCKRYDRVIERLASMPAALIHGEFYASNVLVQAEPSALRICPVDWEMAAVGPGLMDLAALASGRWTEAEKTSLAMAYHSEKGVGSLYFPNDAAESDGPGLPPPFSDPRRLLEDLDYCSLHLAVQWLGWSPHWQPPAEHAHDWLAEALRLADKLNL